jgi:hypothetical protein
VSDARLLLSLALALALLLMGVCSLGYYFSRLSALLQNRQTLSDNFKLFSCKPTLFYALPTILLQVLICTGTIISMYNVSSRR